MQVHNLVTMLRIELSSSGEGPNLNSLAFQHCSAVSAHVCRQTHVKSDVCCSVVSMGWQIVWVVLICITAGGA